MATPKRPTHLVTHKRLYLAVKGKLQHIPEGARLTLTEKQAEGMKSKVRSLKDDKLIDLEPEAKADLEPEAKADLEPEANVG